MQLQLSNICKWVSVGGQKQYILKDLDLTVFEGEFISIMGPSGSGKTTLLNIIGLLDPFDSGQYLLGEDNISKQRNSKLGELSKKNFGFVFQAYHLIDDLFRPAFENKCAAFIASADRAGMLPGLYYRVQKQVDPVKQADQFVDRAISLARGRRWDAPALLLCGDYDGNLPLSSILRFMDRVESRTGVIPVAYLENSQEMKLRTSRADRKTRIRLRRAPYWLALYSHTSGAGPNSTAQGTPRGLLDQYRLWNDWSMWQYGGVDWERGHSRPKVYSHDRYQFDRYFGDMDRPVERNVFRGSESDLSVFWQRHGLKLP